MTNDEWLKTLKKGDEAIVRVGYSHASCRLGVVASVSKGGRITVDGVIYRPDGRSTGDHRYATPMRLEQPTTESIEKAEREAVIAKAKTTTWERLTTEQLRAVGKALA